MMSPCAIMIEADASAQSVQTVHPWTYALSTIGLWKLLGKGGRVSEWTWRGARFSHNRRLGWQGRRSRHPDAEQLDQTLPH